MSMLNTTTSGKSFKKLLLAIASIALLLSIIGISPLITTSGVEASSTQLSIDTTLTPLTTLTPSTTLTPAEVYQLLMSDPSIIMLDTRIYGEYTGELPPGYGHISGAFNLVDDTTLEANLWRFPDKNRPYICYCNVPACYHGWFVATKMWALGYTNVTHMPAGVEGWVAAGYPFTMGTEPGQINPGASFTITASISGTGGTITPSGVVAVNSGASQTFTVTPATGFNIATLTVDGAAVTPVVASYTFTNVLANHTIGATFASIPTFTITASVTGAGGTFAPSGAVTINSGANQVFVITPDAHYTIDTLTVDGVAVTPVVASYTFTNVLANHSIVATFASIPTFTIAASVTGAGGTIAPAGAVTLDSGAIQTFVITPNAHYTIETLTVDDVPIIPVPPSYTFTNILANHSISATFASIPTFTITASVTGAGGTIAPAGAVSVDSGANQAFTITPAAGFTIDTLTVDGVAVTPGGSYTLSNVTQDHTISASFAIIPTFTINASVSGAGGTIAPSGDVIVNSGVNQTFAITPIAGYIIDTLIVDGAAVTATPSHTFTNVIANHTIAATFASIPTFTINASVTGAGGTIAPSGVVTVNSGANQSFTVTPAAGYSMGTLTVDGAAVPAALSHTFTNVLANHTIAVTFNNISTFTINASVSGAGGTIAPSGDVAVNPGADQTFTITAASGYSISAITVDGAAVTAALSHTFTNVTANHTILVAFVSNGTGDSGGNSGGSSSSGGGGGGGSSYSPPPGYTSLSGFVGFEGTILKDAAAQSADKKAVFFIAKGSKFLTASGSAVSGVTITPRTDKPAPPKGSSIIGLCYNFGPEGATFAQGATLTLSYAGLNLGTFNPQNLATAYWDSQAEQWVKLSDCLVDTVMKTVTCQITHFSTYGILGYPPKPATFTTSDLLVTPATVEAGKNVTVTMNVTNTGELSGIYTAALKVEGTVEDSKEVTVKAGETLPVSFTLTRAQTGVYTLSVDALKGSFTALKPATFLYSNLVINPIIVEPNQDVAVGFQIVNSGEVNGTAKVDIQIDGVSEKTQEIFLTADQSQQLIFIVKRSQPGTYNVTVGDLSGSFTALAPPVITTVTPNTPAQSASATAASLPFLQRFDLWQLLVGGGIVLIIVVLLFVMVLGSRRNW